MASTSDNHALAPFCAAVVNEFRSVFGDVKVERVSEGGLQLGKPDEHVYASCLYGGDGMPIEKRDEKIDRMLELAGQG